MEPASELLDEVVVTGYQTISRERATGSLVEAGTTNGTITDLDGKFSLNVSQEMCIRDRH